MKHIQTFVSAAICGLVLTLVANAQAQSIQPGVATVVRITGEARYSLGDGVWHPLVAGKLLAAGAVIQTGHDASVDIVLGKSIMMPQANPAPSQIALPAEEDADIRGLISCKPAVEQNVVRMTSDTVLAIDKLTVSDTGLDSVSDTELDLRQGGIYNSVRKLSGTSQYLIKIPNGIAGVRGTMFYIEATGRCAVYRSSVVLSIIGADGKPNTVVVGEGHLFDPQSGLVSPLPPGLARELPLLFTALPMLWHEPLVFQMDRTTECHVSPNSGKFKH